MKHFLLSLAASLMGKHANQTRKDRERERKLAFHRDMRARLGLPPAKALER
jgi:hypothetical protein